MDILSHRVGVKMEEYSCVSTYTPVTANHCVCNVCCQPALTIRINACYHTNERDSNQWRDFSKKITSPGTYVNYVSCSMVDG